MLNKETFKRSKSEFGDQRESYYVVVICGGMRTSWRKWKNGSTVLYLTSSSNSLAMLAMEIYNKWL